MGDNPIKIALEVQLVALQSSDMDSVQQLTALAERVVLSDHEKTGMHILSNKTVDQSRMGHSDMVGIPVLLQSLTNDHDSGRMPDASLS
jgi:hypothetical protein